jgi:hypothetical protein
MPQCKTCGTTCEAIIFDVCSTCLDDIIAAVEGRPQQTLPRPTGRRLLAMGCRCQLLVGSWNGSPWTCECRSSRACHLQPSERLQLVNDPRVLAAKEKNLQAYCDAGDGSFEYCPLPTAHCPLPTA